MSSPTADSDLFNFYVDDVSIVVVSEPTPTPPTITTATLPAGAQGSPYNQTLAATGDVPITWSVSEGALPGGLTLNGTSGLISGTPTAAGTFNFTVKAENVSGSDSKPLSITVNAATAPAITTASLADGAVGASYSQTLAAMGSTPITWSVASGALPGGLTLSAGGVISGKPTAAGTYSFTVKAANGAGENTKALSIKVNETSSDDETPAAGLGGNPYLPLWEHLPDGEPKVFEDPDNPGKYRAYIFGSHDARRSSYCDASITAWSAPVEDLTAWRNEGPVYAYQTPSGSWNNMYAPDIVEVKRFSPEVLARGRQPGDERTIKEYYLYPIPMAASEPGWYASRAARWVRL